MKENSALMQAYISAKGDYPLDSVGILDVLEELQDILDTDISDETLFSILTENSKAYKIGLYKYKPNMHSSFAVINGKKIGEISMERRELGVSCPSKHPLDKTG